MKCVGIMGFLFGHRFQGGGWIELRHCLRCGMPRGGWRNGRK